jgi:membrane protease YdiL (CAAX protease family)
MQGTSARRWTLVGLAIALLGIPAVVGLTRLLGTDPPTEDLVVVRELSIFALAGLLLWIVRAKEGLSLASIGLSFDRPARSLGRGILLTLACFAVVVATLAVFSVFDVRYGDGPGIARAWPLTLLTVVRAGLVEELFYRGFAIERLEALSGSKWLAAGLALAAFAAFHYRQGPAGVVLALILGGVLTAFYLWKRDLLAAIVAHFLVDFIPNVALPAVSGG